MKKLKLIALFMILLILLLPAAFAVSITTTQTTEITSSSAKVSWQTDANSSSIIDYGDSVPPSLTLINNTNTLSHFIYLLGLISNTTYFYSVSSGDATDNNSGLFYSFKTLALETNETEVLDENITNESISDTTPPLLYFQIPVSTSVSAIGVSATVSEESSIQLFHNNFLISTEVNVLVLDVSLTLTEGVNTIQINAVDNSGNTVTETKTITYTPIQGSAENIPVPQVTPITTIPVDGPAEIIEKDDDDDDDYDYDIPKPDKACSDKKEKGEIFIGILDNEVIAYVEEISMIAYSLCTLWSSIDSIMESIMSACCVLEAASLLSGGAIPPPKQCEEYKKSTYTPWRKSTAIAQFETICCFVTCGWATGDGSCGGFVGPLIDNSLLNKIPVTGQIFNIDGNLGTPGAETVADEFHLDPYDNIYTAVGSMCPVAILTNLRKLSLIYKTYNCCVDQACENGISTDVCEDQLFEATCMYFGGSVLSIIAKILTSILTKYAAQGILFLNTKWLGAWLDCPLSVFQLYNSLVGIYQGTINLVDKILKLDQGSYECEDLGFDKIREESKPVPFQQSPAGKAYEIFTKKQSNFLPRTAELAKIASYEEGEFFIELYGASGKIIVKKFHSLNENNVLTLAKTYYDTDYDGVYDTEVDSEGAWELNIPVE